MSNIIECGTNCMGFLRIVEERSTLRFDDGGECGTPYGGKNMDRSVYWGGGDVGGGGDIGFAEALPKKNNLQHIIVPLSRICMRYYCGCTVPYLWCCIGQ